MINKHFISISALIILAACSTSPTLSLPTARVKEIQETNEAIQHESVLTETRSIDQVALETATRTIEQDDRIKEQLAKVLTELAKEQTSTAIQKSAETPTPADTFEFAELIHYFEGGGGGSCVPGSDPVPTVFSLGNKQYPDSQVFEICLVGFPPGEWIEIYFEDPQGTIFQFGSLHVPEVEISLLGKVFSEAHITLLDSFHITPGDWRVVVSWSGGRLDEAVFPHPVNYSTGTITHNYYPPGSSVNPANIQQRRPYHFGETVYLQGSGYNPKQVLPLGIYHGVGEMKLVGTEITSTDQSGKFDLAVVLDDRFLEDGYYSVVPAGEFYDESNTSPMDGFATFIVQNTLPYLVCDDAPLSYLLIGDKPSLIDEAPNKLRSNPGLDGDEIGKIYPGEQVLVLDGPECSDGFVWWYVLNLVNGFPGWTAEGDQMETWLKVNG